jgi:FSR family fosmidomycin resistance protein-like MFS transporter
MVAQLGERSRGWTMSIFSLGGNVGFALGPVVAAAIAAVGLHWTPIILLPGIGLTLLLALYAPHPARIGGQARSASIRKLAASRWRPLGLIVAVIAIRSGAQLGIIFFLPLYFHARGFAPQLGSFDAFLLSIAGALGGLVGGRLSDMYGRRPIVVGSLALTAPLLAAALLVSPPFAWPLITLAGAALLASNSVTVVQGQELLPENTGIASGLTLGLGFGLSGVITTSMATLSDHVGVRSTILLVPALALLAALLSLFVPDSRTGGMRSPLPSVSSLRASAGGQ